MGDEEEEDCEEMEDKPEKPMGDEEEEDCEEMEDKPEKPMCDEEEEDCEEMEDKPEKPMCDYEEEDCEDMEHPEKPDMEDGESKGTIVNGDEGKWQKCAAELEEMDINGEAKCEDVICHVMCMDGFVVDGALKAKCEKGKNGKWAFN